jgi:MFS superfamily sulfate permease-like transporter
MVALVQSLPLVVGSVAFELIALAGAASGPRVGALGPVFAAPTALAPLATRAGVDLLAAHWRQVAGTAFVLGVIGSLDSLLALAAADVRHNTRHSANRILLGLGAGTYGNRDVRAKEPRRDPCRPVNG